MGADGYAYPGCVRSCPNIMLQLDPYEAIRQTYLDGTDTKSEPFEDPTDTETPESPLAIAPPIPLSESTPPVLIPILCRTTRMAVRVPHAMSSGLFASMVEVAAILPLRKRYRGTSELVEDSKEDDEEIEESMDSDSVSEDAEDEGPTTEEEDPAAEDEGLTAGVESPSTDDEGYGLDDEGHGRDDESRGIDDEGHSVESDRLSLEEEEEEAVPGGSGVGSSCCGDDHECTFRAWPTLTTWTNPEDGMIYIDIPDYPPPTPPVQTPPSPEWTSGLLPISSSQSDDPLPISSPMTPLTVPSPIATPAAIETKGFLTELGAQVQMQKGLISDHAVRLEELSPALFERYDMDIGELFSRSGRLRRRFSLRGENRDLQLQLAEERRARLELAKVVDGKRRG
ncbi:hypothetical protein Tco_0079817 [Tanacetum coccineum]